MCQHTPAVMVNLLGDIWRGGREPDWAAVLGHPGAHLHLYGKRETRPGRKMGHVTVCEPRLDHALETSTTTASGDGRMPVEPFGQGSVEPLTSHVEPAKPAFVLPYRLLR
jgi:phosphoribosylaminoimidazole carboxylase (NCAIR synthetase)